MKRQGPESRVDRRLAELCGLYGLGDEQMGSLASILESLAGEHAPTAVKDPGEGIDVHIADSLAGLEVPELAAATLIADIGSGCGIPGLVLAAALPASEVVAVESLGRRCRFIEEAAARAGIGNIRVVQARAEEWSEGIGQCDAVVARAVAPLSVLVEYSAPLLVLGGALVAWKGTPDDQELVAARRAAGILGMEPLEPVVVTPWPSGGVRQIHRLLKVSETPSGYPRRPGMAAKRPLGG